jgi:hypothetical protein
VSRRLLLREIVSYYKIIGKGEKVGFDWNFQSGTIFSVKE